MHTPPPFLSSKPVVPPFARNDGPLFLPMLAGCDIMHKSSGSQVFHDFSLDAIDPMAVFFMTFEGSARVSFPHGDEHLYPGSILILTLPTPVRIYHKQTGCPFGFLYMNFRDAHPREALQWLQRAVGTCSRPSGGLTSRTEEFVRDTSRMIGEMAQAGAGSELDWSRRTYQWFLSCLETFQLERLATRSFAVPAGPPQPALVADRCRTIKEYARQMHCSPGHISRTLTSTWQKPAGKALRESRLERAAQMLTSSDHSVHQVATHFGYSSPSSFIRAFRRHFGHTPNRLRRAGL